MSVSRSFKKRLRTYIIGGVIVLLVAAIVALYAWGYNATNTGVAKEAVEDYGYTNAKLVSKRLTAFSDDCDGTHALVALVFQAVNTYTRVEAQVIVCAGPDIIKKIYVR
jgi:hypothetical protein